MIFLGLGIRSREAAEEYSPGRKPRVEGLFGKAPSGAKEIFVCAGGEFTDSSAVVAIPVGRSVTRFFRPFRARVISRVSPTAYAMGCIISPLRGWRG